MFDIGFPELMVAAVVALLVIGPERMPEAMRTLGLWFGRARRSFTTMKADIEREIGIDEIRGQLRNEQVAADMQRLQQDVQGLTANPIAAATPKASAPKPTQEQASAVVARVPNE